MELWLLVTERMVLRVTCIIVVGKINYEGEWLNFFLILFFFLSPSHSFWEISVKRCSFPNQCKKALTFVIAGMQSHCTLIEVNRKDPIALLFYKRVRSL